MRSRGFKRFFQDEKGDWAIYQRPNLLLTSWLVIVVVNLIFFHGHNEKCMMLGNVVLFSWAYLEYTRGNSLFRKCLGGVVAIGIVAGILVR